MRAVRTSLLAMLAGVALPAAAEAGITFCNRTQHPVFAAVAYQEGDGSWTSTGWLEVEPAGCDVYSLPRTVDFFYYRGETDWYELGNGRKQMVAWGANGNDFPVVDDDFTFHHAERAHAEARFEPFSPSFRSSSGPLSETVTFNPDDTTTQRLDN